MSLFIGVFTILPRKHPPEGQRMSKGAHRQPSGCQPGHQIPKHAHADPPGEPLWSGVPASEEGLPTATQVPESPDP
eukprot:9233823-Pyramimonas_sp.AAC.1